MKLKQLLETLNLDEKHYRSMTADLPIVEGGLYNTLGRQLFDLYQTYEVSKADQRKIESICFLLQSFVLKHDLQSSVEPPSKKWFQKRWFSR